METNATRLMLLDVCRELVERAKLATEEAKKTNSDYSRGRQFALYELVSLLIDQADAFGVDRAEIGLDEIDPERDLLST